jgi:hypothetical protein
MLRDAVLDEVEILLAQQPLLTKTEIDGGLKFYRNYKVCNQFENEVFEDYFSLEIVVPNGFPEDIPIVKSTDGRIRANNYKGHVYTNGQLCLELSTAIIAFLQGNPSLLAFLIKYLDTYLCGFLFYQKRKYLPFGEHKHGVDGLLDYYCELFETTDIKLAYSLLFCLCRENLKGHIQCPCQSGKRYRDCHREKINELKASLLYERYKDDFELIKAELDKR